MLSPPSLDSIPQATSESPPSRIGSIGQSDSKPAVPNLISLLDLSRGDQWFLGFVSTTGLLAIVAFVGHLQNWGIDSPTLRHPQDREYRYRVEINRASWVEWAQLEGLGEKLAREIVDNRNTLGPFKNIDDLVRVRGIGPTNLERIRPWLICETQNSPSPPEPQAGNSEEKSK